MQSNPHTKFILTPISEILKEAVIACQGIGFGLETQPLSDYIFQTIFLKMTGASEQKLKCICWVMATYDYTYRYHLLSNSLGECSSFDEKKKIFHDILSAIQTIAPDYDFDPLFSEKVKSDIIQEINDKLDAMLENSVLTRWENRAYLHFKSNPITIKPTFFANKQTDKNAKSPYNLFENDLKKFYNDVVYRHRNRCAHNLKSYQNNLPTLSSLAKDTYDSENYFNMFLILFLLDKLYITAYQEYQKLIEKAI